MPVLRTRSGARQTLRVALWARYARRLLRVATPRACASAVALLLRPAQGLRLDYFVCAPELFAESARVRAIECFSLPDGFGGGNASAPSDHCPVGLTLTLRTEAS